jgi:hypothetical protein
MRRLPPRIAQALEKREDDWVTLAEQIASGLKGDKERQLRNIQSIAEGSSSWAALELFIRYQAARGELPLAWAEDTIKKLSTLQPQARQLAGGSDPEIERAVHLELISRVLGYAVRWHVWTMKQKER